MIKIGITGSIAMGKSTISKMFETLGIPVHDSDGEVSKLLTNINVIKKIKQIWPETIRVESNQIDKQKLSNIIFSKEKEKEKLEKLIHPLVRQSKLQFKNFYKNNKSILAFDVPLLYEKKQEKEYDYIFLAICSDKTQMKRALRRKSLNKKIFEKIKQNQLTTQEKIMKNPIIINTEYPKIINFVNILFHTIKIKIKLNKYAA